MLLLLFTSIILLFSPATAADGSSSGHKSSDNINPAENQIIFFSHLNILWPPRSIQVLKFLSNFNTVMGSKCKLYYFGGHTRKFVSDAKNAMTDMGPMVTGLKSERGCHGGDEVVTGTEVAERVRAAYRRLLIEIRKSKSPPRGHA